ncbi:MAG: GNAT family N-acetyltransferase [Candidatus Thorarchaeota archaeon]
MGFILSLLIETCYTLANNKIKDLYIRQLSLSDIKDMVRIEEKCFLERFRFNEPILVSLVTRAAHGTSYAAVSEGNLVGFIIGNIVHDVGRIAEIVTVQVEPALHRNHIGQRLLLYLETELRKYYEINTIMLQVYYRNKGAISFYEANGYLLEKKIRNYYGKKDHALLMKKLLT